MKIKIENYSHFGLFKTTKEEESNKIMVEQFSEFYNITDC